MSDSPEKQRSPSESSEGVPVRRRRGRALLAVSASGAAISLMACGSMVTTNPAPCHYDAGLDGSVADCDGSPVGDADGGVDGGTDAGS
jgi:hypothetical protein